MGTLNSIALILFSFKICALKGSSPGPIVNYGPTLEVVKHIPKSVLLLEFLLLSFICFIYITGSKEALSQGVTVILQSRQQKSYSQQKELKNMKCTADKIEQRSDLYKQKESKNYKCKRYKTRPASLHSDYDKLWRACYKT